MYGVTSAVSAFEVVVPIGSLGVDDRFVVRPGERVRAGTEVELDDTVLPETPAETDEGYYDLQPATPAEPEEPRDGGTIGW